MKKILIAVIAVVALTLSACKPTESNYRAAYDAALAKRDSALRDTQVTGNLQLDDALSRRPVAGDSIWVCHEVARAENDSLATKRGRYAVAVATFKMPTNARAMASDLQERKYPAYSAKDGKGKWYVVAADYPTIEEGAAAVRLFQRSNPTFFYVGLPEPVLLRLR